MAEASTSSTLSSAALAQSLEHFSQSLLAAPGASSSLLPPALAPLRSLSRSILTHKAAARARVQALRARVDDAKLRSMNAKYERGRLEDEIRRCRGFVSIHQTLTLHPLEEFKELAPEELRTPDILEDAHQLRLARLRFELLERKRLAAEKRSLRSTRAALRAQVKEKRAAVQEVVAEITALVEEAKKVEKRLAEV